MKRFKQTLLEQIINTWLKAVAMAIILSGVMLFPLEALAKGPIQHFIARRVAEETKSTAGWSVVTGSAASGTVASTNGWIDNSNFTVGEDYLILVWGYHGTSNTAGRSGIRVTHGGTAFAESETLEETDRTASAYKASYFWFTVWTAANEDLEVEYNNANAAHTGRVEDVTLIAINVEDALADGDLQYNISTAGGTLDATPTTKASITWTPANNNDTWWIMGYSQANITTVGSSQYEARLDIDGTDRSIQSIEGENASDTPVYGVGWVTTLSNASHTIAVQLSESATDEDWLAAGVFALRLNRFRDFVTNATAGTQTLNAGLNTYNGIATITDTPQRGGNWLIVGGYIADDKDGRVTARIQQDNTTNITDEDGGWQHSTADLVPWTGADIASYTNTAAITWDLDSRETNNVTPDPEAEDAWMVGFSMSQNDGPLVGAVMVVY